MKTIGKIFLLLAFGLCAFAQQWEVGGIGGVGFLDTVHVSAVSAGSATAGFAPGVAAGAFFGQNINAHWSGEIRYEFFDSNLKLSGAGTSASFSGIAHAVHYDLIYHTNRKSSPVQFFVAIGGGMKIFDGTGAQEAYQPLMPVRILHPDPPDQTDAQRRWRHQLQVDGAPLPPHRNTRLHFPVPHQRDSPASGRQVW